MSGGKWEVWKSASGAWLALPAKGSGSFATLRIFRTHAEALAYAIEQAEAER